MHVAPSSSFSSHHVEVERVSANDVGLPHAVKFDACDARGRLRAARHDVAAVAGEVGVGARCVVGDAHDGRRLLAARGRRVRRRRVRRGALHDDAPREQADFGLVRRARVVVVLEGAVERQLGHAASVRHPLEPSGYDRALLVPVPVARVLQRGGHNDDDVSDTPVDLVLKHELASITIRGHAKPRPRGPRLLAVQIERTLHVNAFVPIRALSLTRWAGAMQRNYDVRADRTSRRPCPKSS
mmetsp:Transcript_32036/g.70098  ORF Transcript_32036/g.70098 Transcript_32036/m.70098 type:complete len:241 (+) Transcript_32036:3157-3879(+)